MKLDAAPQPPGDEPLPLTFRFVMFLGIAILLGWIAMFCLLVSRW
jgi:hypothetical protein